MKKILALLLALLLLCGCTARPGETTEPTQPKNTMTGEQLMQELKIGWNLGNTFDAPAGETAWGNPFTTPELLQTVKDLGFSAIRIPISWGEHVSAAPEYAINENFLARVEQVVNQALDAGLYVIINSHHDNGIYMPTPENQAQGQAYLTAVWTQVATRFRDADYRLIFQTMNEPRVVGTSYEWNVDTRNDDCLAAMEVVNVLNQTALDAIRATGGKNADRFVMVCPYAGNSQAATGSIFRLPQDSADGKLIVSIHAYTPYNLCLNTNSDEANFTMKHLSEIRSVLKNVNFKFVRNGIPVIIDEMGIIDKNNPEARYAWAKAYIAAARELGMPCIWWDNGQLGGTGENFGLIDRKNLTVNPQCETVYQGLMDGLIPEE